MHEEVAGLSPQPPQTQALDEDTRNLAKGGGGGGSVP